MRRHFVSSDSWVFHAESLNVIYCQSRMFGLRSSGKVHIFPLNPQIYDGSIGKVIMNFIFVIIEKFDDVYHLFLRLF